MTDIKKKDQKKEPSWIKLMKEYEVKYPDEYDELMKLIAYLKDVLSSEKLVFDIIKKEVDNKYVIKINDIISTAKNEYS